VGHRGGFGHAETFHDNGPGLGLEFLDHCHGKRCRSGKASLDGREIGLVNIRVIQHADVHGGYHGRKRGLEFTDGLQQLRRLGFGHQDISPSFEDGKVHGGGEAEDMKKGKCPQHNFIAVEGGKPCTNLLNLFAEIAMGQHDSFRFAG